MNRPGVRLIVGAAAILFAAALPGCKSAERLDAVSFVDPYFPEPISLAIDRCAYRKDRSNDIHIAGEGMAELPNGAVAQWIDLHLYWRPKPGKTHDDPTTADAVIRLLVDAPDGPQLYAGSAFVYMDKPLFGGGKLLAKIESARLRPVRESDGGAGRLGDATLQGKLTVRDDPAAALEINREFERRVATVETAR
ncbi:MAG: hypothetical protein HZB38_08425 [Planctomycetes bacterium]|nr:hypothetical protein [Planctomycetota bacterium]